MLLASNSRKEPEEGAYEKVQIMYILLLVSERMQNEMESLHQIITNWA